MKQQTILASVLALLLAFCAGSAGAATSGDYTYLPADGMTAELISYSGSESEVIIPAALDGYTLIHIGPGAFTANTTLTAVTIPEGAVSIETATFSECENLTSVSLPSSLKSIEKNAFFWCTSLRSISLPSGVTSIGKHAFYHCDSLTSLTIPAGVTSIGEEAFAYCGALTLTVTQGSYAEAYAQENGIPFVYAP